MNKVFHNVWSIWRNLDEAFENNSLPFISKNRYDFLKKLCAYQDADTNNLTSLLIRLNDLSSSLTENELERYAEVIKKIQSVKDILTHIEDFEKILDVSIESVISTTASVLATDVLVSRTLPIDYFSELFEKKIKVNSVTFDALFDKYQVFHDICILENGISKYYETGNVGETDIIIFRSLDNIYEYINRLKKICTSAQSKQIDSYKMYRVLEYLAKNNMLTLNTVLMFSNRFDSQNSSIQIGASKINITSLESNTLNISLDINVVRFDYIKDDYKVPVVCLI